jgi:hypothetical protein
VAVADRSRQGDALPVLVGQIQFHPDAVRVG